MTNLKTYICTCICIHEPYIYVCIYNMNLIRGHPFMTSTRRGARLRWTHVEGGRGGPFPCGRPHRKLKLESTDVILSSSHAKKLASFLPEFHLWTEKVAHVDACGQGEGGQKPDFFVDIING